MKKQLKSFIHSFGWDLRRLSPASHPTTQLLSALNYVKANIVFDVGSNIGQFSQELRSVGYVGKIISFEPLTSAHASLCQAAKHDPRWVVHPRTAVGDTNGEVMINIAGNSVSSSVLPMLEAHSSAAVNSAYISSEIASLVRLDSVSGQYLDSSSRVFLKIDTQGYEWQVLNGAEELLKITYGIMLEMSLTPLYGNQYLWLDTIRRLEALGFTLWSVQSGFTDMRTGRTLQVDGIFLRE